MSNAANTPPENQLSNYVSRGTERMELIKVPDRFTVRMKHGTHSAAIAASYGATHRKRLRRQNVDEFSVDAAARDAVMSRVRTDANIEFASHVYAPAGEPEARLYLGDQLTVQFAPDVIDEAIERLAGEHGLDLLRPVAGVPRTFVFRVGPNAVENPIKIANRLQATAGVLASEPNVAVATKRAYMPSDTLFGEQWHLFNTGGPMLSPDAHIDVPRAWDLTRGVRSVIVAVADDSCDTNHTDFQAPDKIVSPRDFAGQDFEPLPEFVDDNHGTACCGVAVAEETGTGVVGVAPGCALMPIRTTGYIDDTSIEDLCSWVIEHGAAVMSCSWGVGARVFPLSIRMRAALTRVATLGRRGKGCVIVFAAGNDNRPIDGTIEESGWPGNQPSGVTRWLNGFATHADVIAVAASSSLARKSAYSNWGAGISVCAPSNNVRAPTYPRVVTPTPGRGILTTDRVGPSGYSSNDYTCDFGGTSSACPTVAGAAALVLSANPDLTAHDVRQILEATADKIVDDGTDPQLNKQLGAYHNGHSQWFGHGRINAFKAVTEAIRRRSTEVPSEPIRKSVSPSVPIPDNDPSGVSSTLEFSEMLTIASLEVSVDISHTYTTASTPGLQTLHGSASGAWKLRVADLAAKDEGKLNRWGLRLVVQ